VWWVDVPGDLRRGDTLDVLFEPRAGEEPVVHAVRFVSGKMEKTFQAYRFKADGDAFPRFFQPSGEELEQRLEDAPLEQYEQVTSLLRDGRRHKGVDFKTPVGSPVKATFAGTITRKNWSFRGNGNCLELSEAGGQHRKALFLHLSEVPRTVQVGQRIAKGEVLAQSGNTGHSFAPHLHYQLMAGSSDRVLDPFESHKIYRRALAVAQKPALETEIQRLDLLMGATPTSAAEPKVAGN
jgi:murein DD-endopeptidase